MCYSFALQHLWLWYSNISISPWHGPYVMFHVLYRNVRNANKNVEINICFMKIYWLHVFVYPVLYQMHLIYTLFGTLGM